MPHQARIAEANRGRKRLDPVRRVAKIRRYTPSAEHRRARGRGARTSE